jgi:hypothetical protein
MYGWDAEEVDRRVGVPGFAKALPSDWIDLTGEWVKLPEYQEHNGSTGKSRAQSASRQKRHRRNATVTQQPLREALPEKKRKEKKRKEYINTPLTPFQGVDVPEQLQSSLKDWIQYRSEKKKPITKRSIAQIVKEYENEPNRLCEEVKQSILNGWQGLFKVSPTGRTGGLNGTQNLHSTGRKLTTAELNQQFVQKNTKQQERKVN